MRSGEDPLKERLIPGEQLGSQIGGDDDAKKVVAVVGGGGGGCGSLLVEARKLFDIAGSLVVFNVLSFAVYTVSVIFVGHLGELELSSASVALSFASVTGYYLQSGLASGLETLCGQAYGAKQYHLLGVYLQAGTIVIVALSVPIYLLWWNMEPVLIWIGQDPDMSRMSGIYFKWLSPSIFPNAVLQALLRYLQTQSIVLPQMFGALVTLTLHIPLCYLLIHQLGLGFIGGALASTISYYIELGWVLTYIFLTTKCCESWKGFSKEAVRAVPMYLKLAVPSAAMLCLEFWAFDTSVPLAGLLSNPELQISVISVCMTTNAVTFMVTMGVSSAISTRVANELGAGRTSAARYAVKVVLMVALVYASIFASTLMVMRNVWGRVFSYDVDVVEGVAKLTPFLAGGFFLDGIQGVISGVARGCGWQNVGAWINLASYYGIGIPCSILFCFGFRWGIVGLWLGFYLGSLSQTIMLLIATYRTNWDQMVENAEHRINAVRDWKLPLLVEQPSQGVPATAA